MPLKLSTAVLAALLLVIMLAGCGDRQAARLSAKPLVMTTLFPVYDFTRIVAGDRMDVQLLLPPGVEPHHFEPRPDDIVRMRRACLLIGTNAAMEPWVGRLLTNPDLKQLKAVQAADGVAMMEVAQQNDDHDHHASSGNGHRLDPHVWLDFDNARRMVDTIADALSAQDQAGAGQYRANAARLKQRLEQLDVAYRNGLKSCKSRVLLHGGHYAFGYLARKYVLTYRAAVGVNADAEPSPRQLAELVRQIKASGVRAVYTEELVSPRLAQALATETGAQVLQLHGGHNLSREQFQQGIGFIDLMEANLRSLQKGLECGN